ncbi:iron only hydrogenase large subunit-like protein [Sedimentibacter acidaminivorans]|uniref:Iron only hydrogenase large subunit-like protein n=1 Tax=Sedimentibacter acidaminivorans TaxID=913099 RepID=A0ABS4GB55_9FIRM|nr:[Fe-Fe] hydrogenase large subunit C-terminal domain-containing protein [Sedimentibacter acidaminivorans]MBP1924918.1 iron only hydrogenase large subunit-like protein [Sedimentibacter acidaminivorans]
MNFSIMFDKEKCKGCTNCMKRCPTQAIRIKEGKAYIDSKRCIHCGECVKICPHEAYSAQSVESHKEKNYKCKIAIPSTTIYGQFPKGTEICKVQNAILKLGFDYVYDESWASELVSKAIKRRIEEKQGFKPLISTNCPSTVRLIKIRYPSLMEHLISLEAPMEIASKLARVRAKEIFNLEDKDIGVFYISPCPAKLLSVTDPIGPKKSCIDWVVPLNTIYGDLYREVKRENDTCYSNPSLKGIRWAVSGGQSKSADLINYIAVNGMENIINIFDEIENGKLSDVDFVETLACVGGCVGGTFNIENPFIASNSINDIIYNTNEDALSNEDLDKFEELYENGVFDLTVTEDKENKDKISIKEAVRRFEKIKEIVALLPGLDCGSCGAPTCFAHAEDIYENQSKLYDCVVLRAKSKDNL